MISFWGGVVVGAVGAVVCYLLFGVFVLFGITTYLAVFGDHSAQGPNPKDK